jgi:hypothetical protein
MGRRTPRPLRSALFRISIYLIAALCAPLDGAQLAPQPAPNDGRTPAVDIAIDRELSGRGSHTYNVALSARQFINIVVDQRVSMWP